MATEATDTTGDQIEGAADSPQFVTNDALKEQMEAFSGNVFSTMRKMFGDLGTKLQTQQATPPAKPTKQDSAPAQQDADISRRMDGIELDRKFDQAVQGLNLRGRKRELARDLYGKDNPDDSAEWVTEISEVLGVKTETQQPDATQEPSRPGAGSPQPTRTGASPTKMRDWSKGDLDAYLKSKGVDIKDLNQMKHKPVFKELTDRYLRELSEDGVKYSLVQK